MCSVGEGVTVAPRERKGGMVVVWYREAVSWLSNIPLLGVLLAIVSAFLFGMQNVIVKKVSSVDPFTMAFYRFLYISLLAHPIAIYRKEDFIPRGNRLNLIFRCILGSSNLLIHFYGLKHMPIADANMIASASPIWCVIIARIFLKEPLTPFDIVNVLITLTGIVFIIRPPFIFGYETDFVADEEYFYAAIALFLGTLLQATVYILLRRLKSVHFSVTLSMFGNVGALESVVLILAVGIPCIPQCGNDRYMMILVGLISFVAQILLTVALQVEEAGRISLVRKAGDVLFSFLLQLLLFEDVPGIWSIVGAILVSSAVILSGGKKLIDSLPSNHIIKTKYLSVCYKSEDGGGNPVADSRVGAAPEDEPFVQSNGEQVVCGEELDDSLENNHVQPRNADLGGPENSHSTGVQIPDVGANVQIENGEANVDKAEEGADRRHEDSEGKVGSQGYDGDRAHQRKHLHT